MLVILFCLIQGRSMAQIPGMGRIQGLGAGSTSPKTSKTSKTPIKPKNSLFEEKKDTTRVLIADSLTSKETGLQTTVKYMAEDSTIMDISGKLIHLYGKAKIEYGEIQLEADYIKLDWGKSEVFAHGSPDSTKKGEKVRGKPIFSQGGDKYNTDTIRYNFKSKKAIIRGIVTQQGEGYVTGGKVKKDANDDMYLVGARYTTCNLSEPHFHISARKIKLVNKKQIISGPFNFVLNGIPLPIGLPFGFFPVPKNKEAGTSGIIMGAYGEDANGRGFYFKDFGYYFAINEKIGARLTAQIYSNGSLGVGMQSNYAKRYKYSGGFNFQYNYNNNTPEVVSSEDKTNYKTKDFSLSWSHSPANKRPDRSFSSSVNLRSNGFNRNNVNTVDVKNYLSSTSNSSIQLGRTFNQKLVTNAGINVSQNFTTGQMDASANYSLGLNQFNPFIPEKKLKGKWYESFRVGLNVSGGYQASNTRVNSFTSYSDYKVVREVSEGNYETLESKPLTNEEIKLRDANPITLTPEERLLQKALLARLSNIIKLDSREGWNNLLNNSQFRTNYTLPISLPNFKIARYLNFTPSIGLSGDVFTKQLSYQYINSQNAVKIDTVSGFFPTYQMSISGGMNTRVYGTYQFKGKGRLQAIRHTMAPSLSLSYAPDFTNRLFEYKTVRIDKYERAGITTYDTLRKLLPKYPTLNSRAGASGTVNFNLTNQLEAKVRSKSDTAAKAFEKISLLDNLSLSTSYNLLALGDSMNLSNMNLNANTNFFKNLINLNMGASLDPYYYQAEATDELRKLNPAGRVRRFYKLERVSGLAGLATLRSANIAITTRLSPETFNPNKTKPQTNANNPAMDAMKKFVSANPEAYVDFSIPWTISLSYNFNYSKQGLANAQITQALTIQGDFSLTPKWKFSYNSGWDFQLKSPTLTNLSVHRDLHCWDMAFNWTPISGYAVRTSYSFTLNVRSALLQELKVSRRRQFYGSGGF